MRLIEEIALFPNRICKKADQRLVFFALHIKCLHCRPESVVFHSVKNARDREMTNITAKANMIAFGRFVRTAICTPHWKGVRLIL